MSGVRRVKPELVAMNQAAFLAEVTSENLVMGTKELSGLTPGTAS